MKLMESTLPSNYSRGLFEEKCFDLAAEHTDKMFDVAFTGVANMLGVTKTKDHPVAFVFKKEDNSFIMGAMVQFFESEDPNMPGNWNMVCTFDEANIPSNAVVMDFTNPQTHSYFIAAAGEKYGIQYKTDAALCICLVYAMSQLKKWLDENAKEGQEVSIEMDGFFQARVKVENGVKVFAIEPAGEIKQLIKNDSATEK